MDKTSASASANAITTRVLFALFVIISITSFCVKKNQSITYSLVATNWDGGKLYFMLLSSSLRRAECLDADVYGLAGVVPLALAIANKLTLHPP
jgi:hypothetical protein